MSKPTKQLKLVVKNGTIRAIYDDALAPLLCDGEVSVKRASHVEPDVIAPGHCWWSADLTPVDGPILTGFGTRAAALKAEAEYLNQYVIV
jgi:hypothetical protein